MTDAAVRGRLFTVLIIYESLVIALVAFAGLAIARAGGGSIAMASPLLLVACSEALRVPLSGWATRIRWRGKLLAFIALLAISVGSAEGLALVFEQFLNNRVAEISQEARSVAAAQRKVDDEAEARNHHDAETAGLVAQVAAIDAETAALAESMPTPPTGGNRTCSWRGQRVSCGADAAAASSYREAQRAYDARLGDLAAQRRALQAKVDAARADGTPQSQIAVSAALEAAKASFSDKANLSPVYRLVAAVYGEDVSAVSEAQFNRVKRFVVGTLAITFATLSMAVSLIVHLTPASECRPGKLARALRALIAARRKTIRRLRETVRTEVRERVRMVYVPVDGATGRILDPDGKLGETAPGGRP
jgi:hypothetical protein